MANEITRIPRFTTAERDLGVFPVGFLILNSTTSQFEVWSGAVWTAQTGGGGGGANTALSNLATPTALNQPLITDGVSAFAFQTKDEAGAVATKALTVATGFGSGSGTTGQMIVTSGSNIGTSGSGTAFLQSGSVVGAVASGAVQVKSGTSSGAGVTGVANLGSGNGTGTGASGAANIFTGNSISAALTGSIVMVTGNNTGAGGSGNVTITTGTATGASVGSTGLLSFRSGNKTTAGGDTGPVALISGSMSGTGTGNTGPISLTTGNVTAGAGTSGNILLTTGNDLSGGTTKGNIVLSCRLIVKTNAEVNTPSGTLTLGAGFSLSFLFAGVSRTYIPVDSAAPVSSDAVTAIVDGQQEGQMIEIENRGANTITFLNGANTKLPGAVNFALTPNSIISLRWNGTDWVARFVSLN